MDILIIDDNKEITDMISFFLEGQNICCKTVNGGREGLLKIKNEKYDAILLDLTMPEFSGFDIFNKLKEENLLRQNNILLFTASYITDEEIQSMVSAGAKGVIKKPASINNIIEEINKLSQ
jgi:DNA-binding response OmpR family regulator